MNLKYDIYIYNVYYIKTDKLATTVTKVCVVLLGKNCRFSNREQF